jgi:hypothetical protein
VGRKALDYAPAQTIVVQFPRSFKEYPSSKKSGSIGMEKFLEQLQAGAAVTAT